MFTGIQASGKFHSITTPVAYLPLLTPNLLKCVPDPSPGGWRGVLSPEKGTDCGPNAGELWLLGANIAKKEGLSNQYECA